MRWLLLNAQLYADAESGVGVKETLIGALLQEYGHHIDNVLRNDYSKVGGDAIYDEGALFAGYMLNNALEQENISISFSLTSGESIDWVGDSLISASAFNRFVSFEGVVKDFKSDRYEHYGPQGHYMTAYTVALTAGVAPKDASVFAYYTQAPDIFDEFDAANLFVDAYSKQTPKSIQKMQLMQEQLHALYDLSSAKKHGVFLDSARANEILLSERSITRNAMMSALNDKDFRAAGILAHRFGDTYAHTYEKDGFLVPYENGIGHGLNGHSPDNLLKRPELFLEYVEDFHHSVTTATGNALLFETGSVVTMFRGVMGASLNQDRFATTLYEYNKAIMKNTYGYIGGKREMPHIFSFERKDYSVEHNVPQVDMLAFPQSIRDQMADGRSYPGDNAGQVWGSFSRAINYLNLARKN